MNEPAGTACLVCSNQAVHNYHLIDGFQFVKCGGCGFVFTHPMPAQDKLNDLYTGDSGITKTSYPKSSSRRRRALFQAFQLRKYLTGKKRAIDIGCGGGFVVDALRLMGADAYGFDINEHAITYAREKFPKCQFLVSSYDQLQTINEPFDFVFSSEVIEHVSDLDAYLSLLSNLTRDGKFAYITTPDMGSPNRPANVLEWGPFGPPQHIQYFNESNLRLLFERYDFCFVRKLPDKKTGLKVVFRKLCSPPTTGDTVGERDYAC